MISKLLIANRGEIAIRIIRSCREMGIATVAVFSEADRRAPHVRFADEAYPIGPAAPAESYLKSEKLMDVARLSGADAVHPGYGFLAENAEFAKRCADAGITLIGPSAEAMRAMGDKTTARQTMRKAGVSVIPGTDENVEDGQAARIAASVGYPVLVKAAKGGGGKGMRIVMGEGDLEAALRSARSEALSAFGDSAVFIEKFVVEPRHVEFQILADAHGNVVHLGERECSVQRRHQKLIEESPSCVLDDTLRAAMGDAAVKAAKAVEYSNAGTIEFIVNKNRQFYFLEMNTRLQVEHPVTEMRTGLDLVKEQIRIASGAPLPFSQEDIPFQGASIECRISAEDPDEDFMPSTGLVTRLTEPGGPGVRIDSGFYCGYEVPVYYDPMVAKLIVWADTRDEAIARMKRALTEFEIGGIKTTIPFHLKALDDQRFVSGKYTTAFVDGMEENSVAELDKTHIAAVFASVVTQESCNALRTSAESTKDRRGSSPWKLSGLSAGLRKELTQRRKRSAHEIPRHPGR
ncbi:MAG: acetyl-CoA carboxylase biotin carboxylase subunit [Gemmatimonadota bacterium]|nr:acetyl-CoA carboxylase biotin carboxylase subunit [Gemmatimonadota bacterium]